MVHLKQLSILSLDKPLAKTLRMREGVFDALIFLCATAFMQFYPFYMRKIESLINKSKLRGLFNFISLNFDF